MAMRTPKNYQIWWVLQGQAFAAGPSLPPPASPRFHRRWLVSKASDAGQEKRFTSAAIEQDSKNYHAWAHRWGGAGPASPCAPHSKGRRATGSGQFLITAYGRGSLSSQSVRGSPAPRGAALTASARARRPAGGGRAEQLGLEPPLLRAHSRRAGRGARRGEGGTFANQPPCVAKLTMPLLPPYTRRVRPSPLPQVSLAVARKEVEFALGRLADATHNESAASFVRGCEHAPTPPTPAWRIASTLLADAPSSLPGLCSSTARSSSPSWCPPSASCVGRQTPNPPCLPRCWRTSSLPAPAAATRRPGTKPWRCDRRPVVTVRTAHTACLPRARARARTALPAPGRDSGPDSGQVLAVHRRGAAVWGSAGRFRVAPPWDRTWGV